jgi:orotate phosphoribosyltransferase
MTLRRGFTVRPGEKIVVAEDVMTTGGSVAEVIEALESAGAEIAGVACLIDRGGSSRFEGRRVASLLEVDLPTFPADDCPLCRQGLPLVKPGSRKTLGA